MEAAVVRGKTRAPGNRHANQRLRREGWLPCVIYGHNRAAETVALSAHDMGQALEHQQRVIKLDLDGQTTQYLLKEVQYDHLQHLPLHVDLMRVDPNERVSVRVPVELRGVPHGAKEGGVLVQVLADVEVECSLLNIPDTISVAVAHLGAGQTLHISHLKLPEGVTIQHEPEEVVATVRLKRGAEAEEEVAAAGETSAEPEVIGRTAKTEEPEGD